jgi:hypothetical protein
MRRLSAKQQKEIKTRQDLSDDCPACFALRSHPEWLDLNSFSVMIPGELVGLTCGSVRGVCREAMKGKKKSAGCSVNCNDCDVDTQDIGEWYMVKDEVWAAAWPKGSKREFLCIGCLETRLGRRLTSDDFTDATINEFKEYAPGIGFKKSERLFDRLAGSNAKLIY